MAANAGGVGLIPGPRRSPGEGNGKLFQFSCLGNSMDREAWWGHKRVGHALETKQQQSLINVYTKSLTIVSESRNL